ncbi:181_t:CDS:2, partial [Diversispora eburnea]
SYNNESLENILGVEFKNYKGILPLINIPIEIIEAEILLQDDGSDDVATTSILNSRGTANTLEEETDFNDFLDEYKKIIGSNKKMGISVILN